MSDNNGGVMDSGLESRASRVKGRKSVALCAVAVFVLIGLLYLAGFTLEWHRTQISRSLVGELQRLEVGRTTEAQIRKLSDQFGGRYSPVSIENEIQQPACYQVGVSSPYMMIAGSTRTLPGLRLWELGALLEVEDGYLSNLRISLNVFRSDAFLLHSETDLTGSNPLGAPDGVSYYVSEAHITGPPGEALVVDLGPTATMEEREKGFGFNFRCLTALRECRHVCDTMPSAWRDLSPRRRLTYEDGSPVNDYRECSKGTP